VVARWLGALVANRGVAPRWWAQKTHAVAGPSAGVPVSPGCHALISSWRWRHCLAPLQPLVRTVPSTAGLLRRLSTQLGYPVGQIQKSSGPKGTGFSEPPTDPGASRGEHFTAAKGVAWHEHRFAPIHSVPGPTSSWYGQCVERRTGSVVVSRRTHRRCVPLAHTRLCIDSGCIGTSS
jgi:hypothetical protein